MSSTMWFPELEIALASLQAAVSHLRGWAKIFLPPSPFRIMALSVSAVLGQRYLEARQQSHLIQEQRQGHGALLFEDMFQLQVSIFLERPTNPDLHWRRKDIFLSANYFTAWAGSGNFIAIERDRQVSFLALTQSLSRATACLVGESCTPPPTAQQKASCGCDRGQCQIQASDPHQNCCG